MLEGGGLLCASDSAFVGRSTHGLLPPLRSPQLRHMPRPCPHAAAALPPLIAPWLPLLRAPRAGGACAFLTLELPCLRVFYLPFVLCTGGACAFLTLELRPATSDYLSQAVPHIAIPNFVEGLGE